MIKNSGKIYALVLYTGKETKVMLNQGKYKLKKSKIEKQLNILIMANIVLLIVLDAISCALYYHWTIKHMEKLPYLWTAKSIAKNGGVSAVAWTAT